MRQKKEEKKTNKKFIKRKKYMQKQKKVNENKTKKIPRMLCFSMTQRYPFRGNYFYG